jgi:hypothetical protein
MKVNKFEKVDLSDSTYLYVEGRESVKVHLPNGKIRCIEEVHVADLRIKSNSVGKAIDSSYDISFTPNHFFVKNNKSKNIMCTSQRLHDSYKFD